MADSPRETFMATVEPRFVPIAVALADAVDAAGPTLASWYAYRMLVYGPQAHRREWVCAIGTSSRLVHLRFLHGDLLTDPEGRLRPGSSTLMTLDHTTLEQVDPEVVGAYVREAVAKHPAR